MEQSEVAVIGAGPIGLEVAAGLKAAGVPYVHLEAGPIGSTMGWWAPGTRFFSGPDRIAICGVPLVTPIQDKATREDYLTYLRAVAAGKGLDVRTYTRVERISRAEDGGLVLRTRRSTHGVGGPAELRRVLGAGDGEAPGSAEVSMFGTSELSARRVVLAIGDMHRPRVLGVPGEFLPHVSHFLRDPHEYYGRRVLIVGGKNSAVEAAVRLWRVGADVTMSYRGERFDERRVKYWLLPEIEYLTKKGAIGWLPRTVPVEITAAGAVVVDVGDDGGTRPGTQREIAADFVLLLTGYVQNPSLFEQLGVELHGLERAPRFDEETMETNVRGVYVAGTAVAGTQVRGVTVFIENAHVHADRIVAAVTGRRTGRQRAESFGTMAES